MPIHRLAAKVTVSAYTEVEAKTLEDAIRIADARAVALDGGGYSADEVWVIEEADGSAHDIREA